MNKQILLGLGGVVAVGLVGAAVFFNPFAGEKTTNDSPSPSSSDSAAGQNQTMSMSLLELMQLGQSYSCQFTSTDDQTTTDGTVYIAEGGDRFRGEFEVTSTEDAPMQAHMIRDGEYAYMWSSEQDQGVKMRITEEDEAFWMDAGESEESEGSFSLDENQDIDFDCQNWNVDGSMFVPPTDVNFMDYTEQMQRMQEAAGSQMEGTSGIDTCAACDQAPDPETRAQCRSAFGC